MRHVTPGPATYTPFRPHTRVVPSGQQGPRMGSIAARGSTPHRIPARETGWEVHQVPEYWLA
jgi:hypothetical protein